jgi:hypothetical protein
VAWALAAVAAIAISSAGAAQVLIPPTVNDLLQLGAAAGQTVVEPALQHNAEPPLTATPGIRCNSASRPDPSIQGRVPQSLISSGNAARGYWCNLREVAHQGESGGFKVWRYVDTHGRECAYYDTTLLYPSNALRFDGTSQGVVVLDMSNPAHPVKTETLTDLAMLSPHESLNLNTKRGLLAAVLGNPLTLPGLVSIYDLHNDCRHPVFDSSTLVARFGHESGFSPDGKTFWATGTAFKSVTAIDVTNPREPHAVWYGALSSHGMSLSNDGNRAYVADATGHYLAILDTSQVQARRPNPQVREISRLAWTSITIPQNAIPFTEHGHPYLLEFDEYSSTASPGLPPDTVGAGRIIDIANEQKPRVVANLRLAVDQKAAHHAAANDYGAASPVQGYAAHYCNIPTRTNPTLVACSFIASGLRVFDIRRITHPREIAYFIAPPHHAPENFSQPSDFAMSMPAFAPARHEIWYTDGTSGFYVLRLDRGVWPVQAVRKRARR